MCTRYFCQSDKESTIKIMLLLVNPVPIFIEFQVQNKHCVLFFKCLPNNQFCSKKFVHYISLTIVIKETSQT